MPPLSRLGSSGTSALGSGRIVFDHCTSRGRTSEPTVLQYQGSSPHAVTGFRHFGQPSAPRTSFPLSPCAAPDSGRRPTPVGVTPGEPPPVQATTTIAITNATHRTCRTAGSSRAPPPFLYAGAAARG